MNRFGLALGLSVLAAPVAGAQVFINEVVMNPPTSAADDFFEYVELMGTPNMKLDGYAFAVLNGSQEKYYPLGAIPPLPSFIPEIDELFSLDGLSLGANGILVLGKSASGNFPSVLPHSNFVDWNTLWNGGFTPGKIQNDGSNTFVLVRNRPGETEADPSNPAGPIWNKASFHDFELITPSFDPNTQTAVDQFGDGNVDEGQSDGMGGGLRPDFFGKFTGPSDDDLEIVDEVSYEHDRGWEYDFDSRHVDVNSPSNGLPYRHVHAIDDPQGLNSDAISRVDYRTKGNGWTPVAGASGEKTNGNNWQDTATEQWIRGELVEIASVYYYDVAANVNPDAIQPFFTNVPKWLNDSVAPDFNFGSTTGYALQAGRINPLALPFIPGDVDRNGVCDASDITKMRGVFGDDDWLFINSYSFAPQGDGSDPALQTRPWDVDGSGDNGVEASDLQWVLNFQGNTDGKIVGNTYDSPTPSATGVVLNSNAGTNVTLNIAGSTNCGLPLTGVRVGDAVDVIVSAQVTSGANNTAGQQNGIMQFVNDLAISSAGVLKVEFVDPLNGFHTTRSAAQQPQGTGGDLGIKRINAYTTNFNRGVTSATNLYRVVLRAIGTGSVTVSVVASTDAKFAASTPHGLKLGHTLQNGNPSASSYPAGLAVTVVPAANIGFYQAYGTGCPGAGQFVPRLRASGCAIPTGGTIDLFIEHGTPGLPPIMLLGTGTGSAFVGFGCFLQIAPVFPAVVVFPPLGGSAFGEGELVIPGVPLGAAPPGADGYIQFFFQDVKVAATNPLQLTSDCEKKSVVRRP